MDVKIGSRWESIVAEAIDSGRYSSQEEVINEAMALLAEKERRFRELKHLIDEAYEDDGLETTEDVIAAVDAMLLEFEPKAEAR